MSDWSDVVFCLQRMLYMCMETVMGGELFNHLSRVGGDRYVYYFNPRMGTFNPRMGTGN